MNLLTRFAQQHQLSQGFLSLAKQVYLPIAKQLIALSSKQDKPFFVGINGCQGSGKSTLAAFIEHIVVNTSQLHVVVMSLDDFYYPGEQRRKLAKQEHPLLVTRGVPGTHDINQLTVVLSKLAKGEQDVVIPRFNKATDEPELPNNWSYVQQSADIVLIEGWCWGTEPQTAGELSTPVNDLECQQDQKAQWRSYVNRQLAQAYSPLFELMDYWIYLKAPSFDCVYQWRLQQEHQLKRNSLQQDKVMSDADVAHFVSYFQRLTEHSFTCMPKKANCLVEFTPQRTVANFRLAKR